MARRRWQEGTVYSRKRKNRRTAWWGRYVEDIVKIDGTPDRVQRNLYLGEKGRKPGQLTKPLAKRALKPLVDAANHYHATATQPRTMGKGSTLFSDFAARWQKEVLVHKKDSTQESMRGHVTTYLIPEFGKTAMGDIDSEKAQAFVNKLDHKKSVKNIWKTFHSMWTTAVQWKYAEGNLCVKLPPFVDHEMRWYSVEQVKQLLANAYGADRIFLFVLVETGARVGEVTALEVIDVDLANRVLDINKRIWDGKVDVPKTKAGCRSICFSSVLGAYLSEHLAGRTEGYLFQTRAGKPWDADDLMRGLLNPLLERLGIAKYDEQRLAKIVRREGRTIEQATMSEKRAVSLGFHSFRHTNETAMDSLGIPDGVQKSRLGHSSENVTDRYRHAFTKDERDAAEALGDLFGKGWPEHEQSK